MYIIHVTVRIEWRELRVTGWCLICDYQHPTNMSTQATRRNERDARVDKTPGLDASWEERMSLDASHDTDEQNKTDFQGSSLSHP